MGILVFVVKSHDVIRLNYFVNLTFLFDFAIESLVDESGPFFGEIVLAKIFGSKDPFIVFPGKLGVFVHQTELTLRFLTDVLQVWNNLGDLPAVYVIWQDDGRSLKAENLRVLLTFDWGLLLKKILPNVVSISAVWTEDVEEESDVNIRALGGQLPAWKLVVNWDTVGRCSREQKCDGNKISIHSSI